MIKLTFMYQTTIMQFKVEEKNVYYCDKVWKNWLRILPVDENFMKLVLGSRNKLPKNVAQMFNFSDEEKAEYEAAKTERELADNIIRDCKKKGLIKVKEDVLENEKHN